MMEQAGARVVWVLVAVAAVFTLGIATPVGAAAAWDLWSDPQFIVPVPLDWYPSEATLPGSRLFFATPTPLTEEEIARPGGVDKEALIRVRVDALDADLHEAPLERLAAAFVDEYRRLAQAAPGGQDVRVLESAPAIVAGREGHLLRIDLGDAIDALLFVRSDLYLYEVRFMVRSDAAHRYAGHFERLKEGFQIREAAPAEARTSYRTLLAELTLPAEWHVMTVEGSAPGVFITREDPDGDGSFLVGASLIKIADVRTQLGLDPKQAEEVYARWFATYMESIAPLSHRLIGADIVALGGTPSLLFELSFHDEHFGRHIQLFNVTSLVGDDLYTATFEAPVEEYHRYRPSFVEAIRSLRWR